MASHPAQSVGCNALVRIHFTEFGIDIIGEISKASALNRLHDNKRYSQAFSQRIALIPGLLLRIHIVILDLAEIPVTVTDDFIKHFIIIMEGKAIVTDLSFFFELSTVINYTQGFHFFPFFLIYRMQQIEIDIIGLQSLKLLFKNAFCVIHAFYCP